MATVQNQYNFIQRQYEPVVDYCTEQSISFIPWYPLSKSVLSQSDSPFSQLATKYQAKTGQLALAWLLKHSAVIIHIPDTSQQNT